MQVDLPRELMEKLDAYKDKYGFQTRTSAFKVILNSYFTGQDMLADAEADQ